MKVKQTISLLLLAVAMFGIMGVTAVEAGSYDRNAAAQYAINNALIKVPKSDFYLINGGDCTNFVSNVLQKGGWSETGKYLYTWDKAWYFDGILPIQHSYTWGGANNFYRFLYYSSRVSWVSGPSQLQIGDILQMDGMGVSHYPDNVWDHSMIVTGKDSTGLLLSYHSDSTDDFKKNERLSEIMKRNPNARYAGWHVKDTY